MLNREGNKALIAEVIHSYFPKDITTYIEPFFGGGGMFFNIPKYRYSIINDNDNNVINLMNVCKDSANELIERFEALPHSEVLFRQYKQEPQAEDNTENAVRFLYLTNYSLYSQRGTFRIGAGNQKRITLANIPVVSELLKDTCIANCDYRKFIKNIAAKDRSAKKLMFIYCDPPYLGTTSTYNKFSGKDTIELIECLNEKNIRYAISEFLSPFIENIAKQYNLNLVVIGERRNVNNRRVEILLLNYDVPKDIVLELF
jgi:DNA adenine methylase